MSRAPDALMNAVQRLGIDFPALLKATLAICRPLNGKSGIFKGGPVHAPNGGEGSPTGALHDLAVGERGVTVSIKHLFGPAAED